MSSEEGILGFNTRAFAVELSKLIRQNVHPNISLLACRVVHNMLEAFSSTMFTIRSTDLIPALCSKLGDVSVMDVVEQVISVSLSFTQ